MSGDGGHRAVRGLAVAGIALLLIGDVVVLGASLWISEVGCSWGCGEPGSWQNDPDAWQYDAQLIPPLVSLVLLGVALPLAWGGSRRATLVTLGFALGAFVLWATLLASWGAFTG